MKKSRFLLVAMALLFILFVQACTKDNEVQPKVDNPEYELIYGTTADAMGLPRKKRKKR